MYFVTLGHFLASSCASADVIRRQLFAPKPSASASVIFLDPHHGGAPATGLPGAAAASPPPSSPPHAATPIASAAAPTANHAALPRPNCAKTLMLALSSIAFRLDLVLCGEPGAARPPPREALADARPWDAVDRDPDHKSERLDQALERLADAR